MKKTNKFEKFAKSFKALAVKHDLSPSGTLYLGLDDDEIHSSTLSISRTGQDIKVVLRTESKHMATTPYGKITYNDIQIQEY